MEKVVVEVVEIECSTAKGRWLWLLTFLSESLLTQSLTILSEGPVDDSSWSVFRELQWEKALSYSVQHPFLSTVPPWYHLLFSLSPSSPTPYASSAHTLVTNSTSKLPSSGSCTSECSSCTPDLPFLLHELSTPALLFAWWDPQLCSEVSDTSSPIAVVLLIAQVPTPWCLRTSVQGSSRSLLLSLQPLSIFILIHFYSSLAGCQWYQRWAWDNLWWSHPSISPLSPFSHQGEGSVKTVSCL